MSEVRDILVDLGYKIQDHGREFRMRPLYRDSGNSSVLRVYKDTGYWTDFKENKAGPIEELVRLTLGLSNIQQAQDVIAKKYKFVKPEREDTNSKLEHVKSISKEVLTDLVRDDSYWNGRGVSSSTLALFEGGRATKNKMYGRYVFPIYNGLKKLVGITGRYTTGKLMPKWLHQGPTSKWAYPLQVNFQIVIEAREIIIVESIGDMLSLLEAVIKNVIVTFGLRISAHLVTCILKLAPDKVIIALNNDADSGAGYLAAKRGETLLSKHFGKEAVEIKLPCKNDFGCMSKKEILEWRKK